MRLLAAAVTSTTNYYLTASFLWRDTDCLAYVFPARYHFVNEINYAGHFRDLMKVGKY
jgi:hypothetical protein